MDEKTAMNVEFLRARLLSERTVSKTAKQRAEILSQRVIELEEQLRIVNIQRKKAEKAAEEVLSILETQGITCISGLTNLSANRENDQLTDQEGNQCVISEDVKDDKFIASSRMKRSEVDDGLSCSDIDGSISDNNCLSWKSSGNSLDSQEKLKTKQNRHRQRSSFINSLKSSQRRPGKSCRKIKKPDVGSASDNELQKHTLVAHSDDFDEKRECPLETSETKDAVGGKDDMERALEQQAQLIIQFQTMENAQKEWEEKFNDTKMSIMLDNHEPSNQDNVVEHSNCSLDNLKLVGWITKQEKEEKTSVKDISFPKDKTPGRCRNCDKTATSPSKKVSNGRTNGAINPMLESTYLNVIETSSKESTIPSPHNSDLSKKVHLGSSNTLEKPEFRQEHPRLHPSMALNDSNNVAQLLSIPSQEESLALLATRKDLKGSSLRRNSKQSSTISRSSSSNLGSVLQSLQQARTSIKDELVKRPNPPIKPEVPIDSSVLFKLPSDSFPQDIYGSGLRLSATRPDLGFANRPVFTVENHANQSGSKASFSEDYVVQYPSSPFMDNMPRFVESESRVSTGKEFFDRRSSSSISASSASGLVLSKSSSASSREPYRYNYRRLVSHPF